MNVSRNSVWSDFDKMFDDFFDMTPAPAKMKVDIVEEDGAYVLEAELPGFTKEDIKVELKDDYLTIAVEKVESKETEEKNYLRRERSNVSYKRSFYIENIEDTAIEASFKDGILSLRLPKKEVEVNTAKQIEIK